ncbi:protein kinase domain-containing protein [Streptomyces fructofermentans]|uniref:protein kinase domain-containing protein n=1 Tax=Streptomyces fructofermentans TaxID=152141 RepID=UPI00378D8E39
MADTLLAGRYRLHDILGRGGMGVVWRAVDERIDRTVALKVLPPAYGAPAAQQRLAAEARALGRLWDPRVVAVLDYGQDRDGTVFVVMELVTGRTLDEAAANAPVPVVLDWAAQICQALEVTHAAGLLHRDIKPRNVMVTSAGTVKLLDFGIARFVRDTDRPSGLTLDGQVLGTPAYMAPEQLGPPDAVDGRADLYALGGVLYELLTGALPQCGGLYDRTLPPPPSALTGGARCPELDALVLALLAPSAGDRPEDAAAARRSVAAAMDAWTREHGPGALPGAPVGPVAERPPVASYDPTVVLGAQEADGTRTVPVPGSRPVLAATRRLPRHTAVPASPLARVRELADWQRAHPDASRDPRTPAVRELRHLVEELATPPQELLTGCDLSGLNLDGSVLIHGRLAGARLTATGLSFALMSFADLRGARPVGCDFSGAYLGGAVLAGADLTDARFYAAHLTEADLTDACLRRADLTGARLSDARLVTADLRGAVLRGAALREALLCGADLSGADLRGADLTGSDPSGARWSVDTHWPFEQSALRRLSRPSGEAGGFVLPDPRTSPRLRRLLDGTG